MVQGLAAAASTSGAPTAPVLPIAPVFTPAIALYYPAVQQAHAEGQAQPGALAYPIPGAFGAAGMVPWPYVGPPGQPPANAAPSSSAGQLLPGARHRFPQRLVVNRFAQMAAAAQQHQAVPAAAAAGGGGDVAAAAPAAGAAAGAAGHRRYRTRTITFRISARTLLQALVFGIVLYQHCTWPRFLALLAGVVVLYLSSLWAPVRQFIRTMIIPPRPHQRHQRHRAPGAEAAVAAGDGGGAEAAGGAAAQLRLERGAGPASGTAAEAEAEGLSFAHKVCLQAGRVLI